MVVDFPTILFFVSIVFLVIWIVDERFFRENRDQDNIQARAAISATESMGKKVADEEKEKMIRYEPIYVEYAKAFLPILVLVLLLRSFVAEPFRIPSPSMVPTLLSGDFILVSKSAYGIRLPMINKRVVGRADPKRGEVVVFRYPEEPTTYFIKRLVGLPGDKIMQRNGKLYINGKVTEYKSVRLYRDSGAGVDFVGYRQYEETLGTISHAMLTEHKLTDPGQPYTGRTRFPYLKPGEVYTVPKGYYFMMGDNRNHSSDSRFWGPVRKSYLVGRAVAIWYNFDPKLHEKNGWFGFWKSIRGSRMFTGIK